MTDLRAYQSDVLAEVTQVIAAGQRRIILVAPTGAGKTVIAQRTSLKPRSTGASTFWCWRTPARSSNRPPPSCSTTASSTASSRPAS